MYKVVNNRIYLTRGDSASFPLSVTDKDGVTYVVQPDDAIVMTLKKTTADKTYLIQKQLVNGAFSFAPSDTDGREFGDYVYDVQLTMGSGYRDTIIPPTLFRITEEVTC
ncbi:hypothetical protein [Megasphaera sueciensis]|uniref:hypothetical protein n=1 Tax=Megasphaera sueciensis TaxID=349094 RepID=UPI003D006FAE